MPIFEKFMREQHVPGLVYGVVVDGKLARVRAFGVRDVAAGAPVTPDTAFRIASMSKQLTALATLRLRDAGRVSLDAPAEKYIPEMRKWHYPTSDSPKITVRDLLSHAAGLVTDDPWGDRQLDMTEADFTRFVAAGVPFSRAPGMAYEYSNFGFALVGRLITNTARTNYSEYIAENFFRPLGMQHTVWDIGTVPAAQRAIGYRWENDAWVEEPVLGPGTFGAMGGLITTANDYARYVAWLLAAWPPRDGAEDGILRRSSVREITRPANYATVIAPTEPSGCARSASYGFGVIPFSDCVLGSHFGHSGGLPGYGSNVLFLPQRGVGGVRLHQSHLRAGVARGARGGQCPGTVRRLSGARNTAEPGAERHRPRRGTHLRVGRHTGGARTARRERAARSGRRAAQCAHRRTQEEARCLPAGGSTDTDSAMSMTLAFNCARGKLKVKVVLAPTKPATVQTLQFVPEQLPTPCGCRRFQTSATSHGG